MVVENLLVVAIMEGTVCDTKECLGFGIVAVLAIAFEKGQSCEEISLLQEVGSVWQFHLLLNNHSMGSTLSGSRLGAWQLTCFC